MNEYTGWLLDLYSHPERGIILWLIGEDGGRRCFYQDFPVTFYAAGPRRRLHDLCLYLKKQPYPIELKKDERRDLITGMNVVLSGTFESPAALSAIRHSITRNFPDVTFYDADLHVSLRHAARYGSFPLARCFVAVDEHGRIQELQVLDSRWEIDVESAPLRILTLEPDVDPFHDKPKKILARSRKSNLSFDLDEDISTLAFLNYVLKHDDPDLIITSHGDTWMLPLLLEKAARNGLTLEWNRDPGGRISHRKERSYHAYNQIIFRGRQVHLAGRVHLDILNTVMYGDYGINGVLEMSRVTSMPLQTAARVSPGTGISSMQIVTALKQEILVPLRKGQFERPKTPSDFFDFDKGGMFFDPIIGLHADAAEVDFFSMYPSIMTHFNISPETAGAVKMTDEQVSGLVKMVMGDAPGLIPQTLAPLLEKRFNFKNQLLSMSRHDCRYKPYKASASAHKWLLVTCFGYLGYKNARFGRIEAHEAVTAYGREILLRAKETAEDMGYRVLHLYVDGMWVVKAGYNKPRHFRPLLEEIRARTTLPIALDGIYRFVAFLPSRLNKKRSVPNRYFGIFQDGEIKTRGIETRRHDTPQFIKDVQMQILEIFSTAPDASTLPGRLPQIHELVRSKLTALRSGVIPLKNLVIHQTVSRTIDQFSSRSSPAFAALQQLEAAGKSLRPGQSVRLIHTRGIPRARAWDLPEDLDPRSVNLQRYEKLFMQAVNTIIEPITGEKLSMTPAKQLPLEFEQAFGWELPIKVVD